MNPFRRLILRIRFHRNIKTDETINVVDSMVKARKLYKELSMAAHPDKHPHQMDIAEDIMKRLTANKHSYASLILLKKEIEERLK